MPSVSYSPVLDNRGRQTYDRAIHGGFEAARFSRSRSLLNYFADDADKEYSSWTRTEMTRKARWMKKNIGFVRGIRSDIREHGIGPGVFPIPSTGDAARDEEYYEYFCQASKIADVRGRMSWFDYQGAKADARFDEGDIFTMHLVSPSGWPQFQSIRSHNVGNFGLEEGDSSLWKDGIKTNAAGRPVAVRVREKGTSGKARTVPYIWCPQSIRYDDVDDVRGKTALAHAINNLHDIIDSLTLEKGHLKDASRTSRVITSESGLSELDRHRDYDPSQGAIGSPFVEAPPQELKDASVRLEQIFGSELVRLRSGEKLEAFVSNRPSPTFTGFLDYLGRDVTAGCRMPWEFSWNPGGIASGAIRTIQNKVNACCRSVQRDEQRDSLRWYFHVILTGIASGHIKSTGKWYGVEWLAGAPEVSIDKGRDARVEINLIESKLLTLKRYFAKQGLWYRTEMRTAAEEQVYLGQLAEEFDLSPDWYKGKASEQAPLDLTDRDGDAARKQDEEDEDEDDEDEKKKK